jgi:hypothetical protein
MNMTGPAQPRFAVAGAAPGDLFEKPDQTFPRRPKWSIGYCGMGIPKRSKAEPISTDSASAASIFFWSSIWDR